MPDDLKPGPRRTFDRFISRPASLLIATLAIIIVTVVTVLLGALFIYVFDRTEFNSYGEALWFTLQTSTTVGYGDITPRRTIGRIAAAIVMLVTLGLLTVLTATITSYFIRSATRSRDQADHTEITTALAQLEASLVALSRRLDDLSTDAPASDGATPAPSDADDQ